MFVPQLTFLRFMAAMLVVLYHYGSSSFGEVMPWFSAIVSEGAVAVGFFFFLSGSVISLRYTGQRFSAVRFWHRRAARIMPLYVIAFLLTLTLQVIMLGDVPRGNAIVLQILALHAWIPEMCLSINYPGWSISVEVFFYLLFPLLFLLRARLGFWKWALFVVIIWALNMLVNVRLPATGASDAFILYFPAWHLGSFIAGILCGDVVLRSAEWTWSSKVSWLLLVLGIAGLAVLFGTDTFLRGIAHNGGAAPCFFLILAGLAWNTSLLARVLSWGPLVLLGEASYGVYLLQYPVFLLYTGGDRAGTLTSWNLFAYCALLVLVAVCVFKFIERPMKEWLLNLKSTGPRSV